MIQVRFLSDAQKIFGPIAQWQSAAFALQRLGVQVSFGPQKLIFCYNFKLFSVRSSAVERYSYKVDVLGSNPSGRTNNKIKIYLKNFKFNNYQYFLLVHYLFSGLSD